MSSINLFSFPFTEQIYRNNVTPPETSYMNFDRYGKNLNSRTYFSALFWVNSPTHKYGHCLTEGLWYVTRGVATVFCIGKR